MFALWFHDRLSKQAEEDAAFSSIVGDQIEFPLLLVDERVGKFYGSKKQLNITNFKSIIF